MQGVVLGSEQTAGLGRTAPAHGADAGRGHVYGLVVQRGRRLEAAVGHLYRVLHFDAPEVAAGTAQASRALAPDARYRGRYPLLVDVEDLGERAGGPVTHAEGMRLRGADTRGPLVQRRPRVSHEG